LAGISFTHMMKFIDVDAIRITKRDIFVTWHDKNPLSLTMKYWLQQPT